MRALEDVQAAGKTWDDDDPSEIHLMVILSSADPVFSIWNDRPRAWREAALYLAMFSFHRHLEKITKHAKPASTTALKCLVGVLRCEQANQTSLADNSPKQAHGHPYPHDQSVWSVGGGMIDTGPFISRGAQKHCTETKVVDRLRHRDIVTSGCRVLTGGELR